MSRDDAVLLDIIGAAQFVVALDGCLKRGDILGDSEAYSAALRQLVEVLKRVSEAFRSGNPQIPRRPIAGMSDNLICAYDRADMEKLWRAVQQEAPRLIELLEPLLHSEDQG